MILLNFYCPLSPLQHWGVNPPLLAILCIREPDCSWGKLGPNVKSGCDNKNNRGSLRLLLKHYGKMQTLEKLLNNLRIKWWHWQKKKKMGIPTFSQSWTFWILAESRMGHPSQLYKQQLVVQGFSCIKLSPLQDF